MQMFVYELPTVMIRCLSITVLVEVIMAIIIGIRDKKDLLNVVLVNIVTNPIVVTIPVYFNYRYGLLQRNICLVIFEIATLFFEGFIYYKYLNYKKINGFLVSAILNLASFAVGEMVNYLLVKGNI